LIEQLIFKRVEKKAEPVAHEWAAGAARRIAIRAT